MEKGSELRCVRSLCTLHSVQLYTYASSQRYTTADSHSRLYTLYQQRILSHFTPESQTATESAHTGCVYRGCLMLVQATITIVSRNLCRACIHACIAHTHTDECMDLCASVSACLPACQCILYYFMYRVCVCSLWAQFK